MKFAVGHSMDMERKSRKFAVRRLFMPQTVTKVELSEARIYEETLQVLLYENRNDPDQGLLQDTSSVHEGVGAGGLQQYASDEEEERTGLARLRSNERNNPA